MDLRDIINLAFYADDPYIESNTIADIIHYAAINNGWQSRREAPAPTKGRKGRIDLLVSDGGCSIAIEVGSKGIKTKSVEKLRSLDVSCRVCIISRGTIDKVPDWIDAVVSIRDRRYIANGALVMLDPVA